MHFQSLCRQYNVFILGNKMFKELCISIIHMFKNILNSKDNFGFEGKKQKLVLATIFYQFYMLNTSKIVEEHPFGFSHFYKRTGDNFAIYFYDGFPKMRSEILMFSGNLSLILKDLCMNYCARRLVFITHFHD